MPRSRIELCHTHGAIDGGLVVLRRSHTDAPLCRHFASGQPVNVNHRQQLRPKLFTWFRSKTLVDAEQDDRGAENLAKTLEQADE